MISLSTITFFSCSQVFYHIKLNEHPIKSRSKKPKAIKQSWDMGESWIAGKKERGLKEEGKRNALFSLYTVTYHLLSVNDQPISL